MAGAAAPNGCCEPGVLAALAGAAALAMVGTARSAAAQGSPAAERINAGRDAADPIIRDDLVRDFRAELCLGWSF
jgi:hypothetical protein